MKYIMVADKSITIRAIAELVLKKFGYGILHADNGDTAFDKIIEVSNNGDIVLLCIADINLLLMNGSNFISEFKKKYSTIPVLMMVTDIIDTGIEKCRQMNASGYIIKPFRPEKLLDIVNNIVNH
jgi:two-component system, chemotaxis family, chemotaxis protein CheY